MEKLFLLLAFIFGSILGSFLNVVILRLPKEEGLNGRSHCNSCGHTLTAAELVPIFSFLAQKGKCKHCKKGFSPRYFLIELITGLLIAFTWFYFKPGNLTEYLVFSRAAFLVCSFLVIFVIDLEHYLILDKVVFFSITTVLVLGVVIDMVMGVGLKLTVLHFALSIVYAAGASLPFFSIWYFSSGRWMGFGDVKLALLLGVVAGWPLFLVNIMLAVFMGGFVSVALLIFSSKTLKSQIPFGTFLSVAAVVTMFCGQNLLRWYLALLGV